MNSIKSVVYLYVIGLFFLYSVVFIYNRIYYHNMMNHAAVTEAVLTERFKLGRCYYYEYSYRTKSDEYTGSMAVTKSVSVGDTIMIVYDQHKNMKSKAIKLRKGKAIFSNECKECVIVNNKTEDEKKEIADKLMADLKERYHVNE